MATKYQVQCMDENIHADEAYVEGSSPLFSTATEAENFMAECINDWPEGSSMREAYEVHEVEAYLDDETK